ncbi:MAG: hypothetical protein KF869_14520 [Phycisphaeraceae bacterium]|nr:hypothetical protein [Phycisphaeraceae bacterium]
MADHRGRDIALLSRALPHFAGANPADIQEAFRQTGHISDRRVYVWRLVLSCLLIAVVCGVVAGAISLTLGRRALVLAIVTSVVMSILIQRLVVPMFRVPTITDFLRIGRCPQCAYLLQGLMPEQNGCIICPECGAAWRKDSVGSTKTSA